jgi:hypothetical protein
MLGATKKPDPKPLSVSIVTVDPTVFLYINEASCEITKKAIVLLRRNNNVFITIIVLCYLFVSLKFKAYFSQIYN